MISTTGMQADTGAAVVVQAHQPVQRRSEVGGGWRLAARGTAATGAMVRGREYATVWAAIDRKPSATERVSGEQMLSFQQVVFNIRYSTTVNILEASHRVSYDGKIYNVLGVQEVGRQEQLRVVTELRENS